MKMTDEQQKLVTDNIKFIYWLANNMSRTFTSIEKDELISMVMECFTAAAIKYNPNRDCSYIQFASIHTRNKILSEISKRNVRAKYSAEMYQTEYKKSYDPADTYLDLQEAIQALPERNRKILIDYYYNGLSQPEIALKYGFGRPWINEILRQSRKAIKEKIA